MVYFLTGNLMKYPSILFSKPICADNNRREVAPESLRHSHLFIIITSFTFGHIEANRQQYPDTE